MSGFQVPLKKVNNLTHVTQIVLDHAPKCCQNKHDTYTISVYLYRGWIVLVVPIDMNEPCLRLKFAYLFKHAHRYLIIIKHSYTSRERTVSDRNSSCMSIL